MLIDFPDGGRQKSEMWPKRGEEAEVQRLNLLGGTLGWAGEKKKNFGRRIIIIIST